MVASCAWACGRRQVALRVDNGCAGQADKVADWYNSLGFVMPYGVNAADFILDLASGDVRNDSMDGEESREFLIAAYEQYSKDWPQYDGFKAGQYVPTGEGLYEPGSFKVRVRSQVLVLPRPPDTSTLFGTPASFCSAYPWAAPRHNLSMGCTCTQQTQVAT